MSSTTAKKQMTPEQLALSLPKQLFVADTYKDALYLCMSSLDAFGYNAIHMSNKFGKTSDGCYSVDGHPAYRFNSSRNNQRIYCARCTTHNADTFKRNKHFQCTVVATCKQFQRNDNKYCVQLMTLYPHYQFCNMQPSEMTRAPGVGGWGKIRFDFDSIIGNTLIGITNKIDQLKYSDLKTKNTDNGKVITSGATKPHSAHDYRYQIQLTKRGTNDHQQQKINSFYQLNEEFASEYEKLCVRVALFLANHLGIASELHFSQQCHNQNIPQCSQQTNGKVPHLTLEAGAVLFGGVHHDRNTWQNPIPQLPHFDFPPIQEDGNVIHVADNDALQGMTKPTTILIPLVTYRTVIFHSNNDNDTNSEVVKAEKGELIYFDGNQSHSGFTYSQEETTQLHPALHLYLHSSFHPCDLSLFLPDANATFNLSSTFAPILNRYAITLAEVRHTITDVRNKWDKGVHNDILSLEEKEHIVKQMEELLTDMKDHVNECKPKRRSKRKNPFSVNK